MQLIFLEIHIILLIYIFYKTKFSYIGFNYDRKPFPYTIFDEALTDEKAMELFDKIKATETLTKIDLLKYVRTDGCNVLVNWKLEYGDFNNIPYEKRVEIGVYNIIIHDTALIKKELLKNKKYL